MENQCSEGELMETGENSMRDKVLFSMQIRLEE